MKVTYERDVAHCEVNPNVRVTHILSVEPAENSDHLELVKLRDMGWSLIAEKGRYSPGDEVLFIPPESILPVEFSDLLGVTKYLAKGRVKVARLRGNRSEGLIVGTDFENLDKWTPHILKWEDPPTMAMKGEIVARADIPIDFETFYKIPNLLDYPNLFEPGERIFISEKIHGTNARCGILTNPETGEAELYIGSRRMALRESKNNLYWHVLAPLKENMPIGIVLYGEIFGPRVQHMTYDRARPEVLFFAATRGGEYYTPGSFIHMCKNYELPRVSMHPTVYTDVEKMRSWAEEESEVGSGLREGIVIVSAEESGKMAKLLSFEYLKQEGRTERH